MDNPETRPRDSVRERMLAQQLRQQPEETRFRFIQELLKRDYVLGLILANACLRNKNYFKAILRQGLEGHQLSDIKLWLKCVTPRLGFRHVVLLVAEKLETNPEAVNKALYYLCGMLPKDDPRGTQALMELGELMEKKGLVRKPYYVPRRTLFGRVVIRRVE